MKQSSKLILALAAATPFILSSAGPSFGQTKSGSAKTAPNRATPRIAVVDYDSVARRSKAMKGVQAEMLKTRKRYQKEFDEEKRAIELEARKLERDRPNITGRAFDKRRRDIEARAVNLRRQTQQRTGLLRQAFARASIRFRDATVAIVKELSVEKGYDLVLAKAMVLHNAPQFSISDEVLARLNDRLPSVKFTIPNAPTKKNDKPRNSGKKTSPKK